MNKSVNPKDTVKSKLNKIKKQIETDFYSKYEMLKGIDRDVRNSESKLRNLIKPQVKKRKVIPLRNTLSEQTVQDAINKFSTIYFSNFSREIKKTNKDIKNGIEKVREPFKKVRVEKRKTNHLNKSSRLSKLVLKINNYQVRKSNFMSMIVSQKKISQKINSSLFLKL